VARLPDSLVTTLSKNWDIRLIAAIIALVLWLLVLASKAIEATKEVPVVYKTSEGLVVGPNSPEKVLFRLSGARAFLRSVLERPDTIIVNLESEKKGSALVRFFSDSIEVPLGVRVAEVSPSIVNIKIEKIRSKWVPLRLVFSGSPPSGFELKETSLSPEKVLVKGPSSVIPTVKWVQTQAIDLNELKESTSMQVDVTELGSNLDVEVMKSPVATLEIIRKQENLVIGDVPIKISEDDERVVQLTPSTVEVILKGAPEKLQSFDKSSLKASVSLKNLQRRVFHDLSVSVELPEGLELIEINPPSVKGRIP
jgi:YbbR domain-containing protein